jgi:hypothetical protein
MNNIDTITSFLGWCSVINTITLLTATLMLSVMRNTISAIHSKMLGINQEALPMAYMQYLGNYKIAILMLNIVPYVALKIMN